MFLHTSKTSIYPSRTTHTSSIMNTKFSDEELLARAHGTEVLSAQLGTSVATCSAETKQANTSVQLSARLAPTPSRTKPYRFTYCSKVLRVVCE